ncbi:hypothetical protein [Foetidibacter luteolus]|uniref:hypothetical protein n=1 Tax=Foetidibacter luteolus TaxID=2608880 RepID=UPI00129AE01D|nr:hypothetical protein [Foetidibacter luteolus]
MKQHTTTATEGRQKFSTELSKILEAELRSANKIAEIFSGWGGNSSTLIILERPFTATYHHLKTSFKKLSDPHYWMEEYRDENTGDVLACKW